MRHVHYYTHRLDVVHGALRNFTENSNGDGTLLPAWQPCHQGPHLRVECDVLHGVRVSLEGPLVVAGLEVPHLEGGVLAGRHHHAEDRVEEHPGHRGAVPGQGELGRRARDPLRRGALLAGRRPGDVLLLGLGQLRLQLVHLGEGWGGGLKNFFVKKKNWEIVCFSSQKKAIEFGKKQQKKSLQPNQIM